VLCADEPQHFLYFLPLPHVHGSLRPTFLPAEDFVRDPEGGIVRGGVPGRKDAPPANIDPECAGFFP
jgi:hypothetical protein